MTDARRRWGGPALTGAAAGLLVTGYWMLADWMNPPSTTFSWPSFFVPILSAAVTPLLPVICWRLHIAAGYRRTAGFLPGPAAVLGSLILLVALWTRAAFVYGSPRPPMLPAVLFGVLSFLVAAALCDRRLAAQITAVALCLALAGLLTAGRRTSAHRDRLHGFTALAGIAQVPDPSRWRVVSASVDSPRHRLDLKVEPTGGGTAVSLSEVPVPAGWHPPRSCGPGPSVPGRDPDPVLSPQCMAFPAGGWQRSVAGRAVELLDLRWGALVMTSGAAPAVLRDLLDGLRPADPAVLSAIP